MTLDQLRDRLAKCEAEGRGENDGALTFVASSSRGLGVRPKLLSEHRNGAKVYLITVKQLRRMIARAS